MFGLPIGLLIRVGLALALVAALAYAYHRVAESFRDQGRAEVQAVFDAYKTEQQRRVTEIVMQQQAVAERTEAAARKQEIDRAQTFATLQAQAKSVAAGSGVRFGKPAVELFDRARDSAAVTTPGPAGKPESAVAAPADSAEEFVVAMYAWAAVCKARVTEWEHFYSDLQSTVKVTP